MTRQSVYALLILPLMVLFACNRGGNTGLPDYYIELYKQRASKDDYVIKNHIIEQDKASEFKGLKYFEPDSAYRVKAGITWVQKEKVVFRTNSERSPVYYKFCLLDFHIGDSACRLMAYAEEENGKTGLFIPFKDLSSNKESYGGGRYIEMPYKGEQASLILDFNLAFNPYCHYNHTYSCPLVPFENTLNVAIKAGEQKLYE